MDKSEILVENQKLERQLKILEKENKMLFEENRQIKEAINSTKKLNFDSSLDFAKSLIEHRTHVNEIREESCFIPEHDKITFNYDDLLEIAYYLITYVTFNNRGKRR